MERQERGPTGEPWIPNEVVAAWHRACRLEWLTLAYLVSVVALLAVVMGSSQAMKSAWLDDMLAVIPPAAFLLSTRYTHRKPNARFQYGYHRAATIAYLAGSLALVAMGLYLGIDAIVHLATRERPHLGRVHVLGHAVWQGWLMIGALVWSAVPAFFLGRAKRPLAHALHDKGLIADAEMNHADWIAAAAAMAGVAGIGLGLWWADALAGGVIAIEILRDGVSNVKRAVHDLMDHAPEGVDGGDEPLVGRLECAIREAGWVRAHRLRVREQGHVLVGEVEVVPAETAGLLEHIEALRAKLQSLDWRMHEVVVAPVRELS